MRRVIWRTLAYAFLIAYALAILYPLFFITVSSMKSNDAIFITPWAMPQSVNVDSYTKVWTQFNLGRYFLNSVYYAGAATIIAVTISAMASYGVTRLRWKLKGVVFGMILLGLMVPIHSELVPIYIIMTKLGVREPRVALPLVYIAFAMPITVFIVSGYMRSIPRAIEESAVMEGASIQRCFFTIVLPVAKPAMATVLIFNFITIWNDFFAALVFINQDSEKTIQLGIAGLKGVFVTQYSDLLAAVVIAIIPSVIVYALLQDKIVEGMTAGAVKG
jgi:raffinose/stachyose/melibiose transport system permease protein